MAPQRGRHRALRSGRPSEPQRLGGGDRYTKRHPVPYGEYIPYRSLWDPEFGQLALISRDMKSGTRTAPLRVAGLSVADAICFDVAYDDVIHGQLAKGDQPDLQSWLRVLQDMATYGKYFSTDELKAIMSDFTPFKADWARLSHGWRPRLDARIKEMEKLRDELTGCIGCGCLSLRTCRLINRDDIQLRNAIIKKGRSHPIRQTLHITRIEAIFLVFFLPFLAEHPSAAGYVAVGVMSWVTGALLFSLHAFSLYLPGARRLNLNAPLSSVTTYAGCDTTTRYALMFACKLHPRRMMPS